MAMRCCLKKNYRDFIDRCLESVKTRNANIGKIKKLVLIDVASAIKPTNMMLSYKVDTGGRAIISILRDSPNP